MTEDVPSDDAETDVPDTGKERSGPATCDCGSTVDEDRRNFMQGVAAAGATTLGAIPFTSEAELEAILQKHFKEMSEQEKAELVERLEKKYREKYDTPVDVSTAEAEEGVVFGYALDIQKCIGCRRCVYACVEENNQSREAPGHPETTQLQWIRVLELPDSHLEPGTEQNTDELVGDELGTKFGTITAGISYEESDHYYDPDEVPEEDTFYLPVQCQHCEDPPCVKACPTQATWKEPDGIVVVDYDWCIGCRYCMTACPYYARRFNPSEAHVPEDELNPDMHYLGNRPRPEEAVEKCTFCIQRSREGEYPACVEACPVGARKFGNLLDPENEIRRILDQKRVFRLKQHLGTEPKFFYFME